MYNATVKILTLDKPLLSAANAQLNGDLYSIYFSPDKKLGYIINPKRAFVNNEVIITEGPDKIIGKGKVISVD